MRVLPQPALPQIKVGRPFGKPPSVISSSPVIPVSAFGRVDLSPFSRELFFSFGTGYSVGSIYT
jgi:hypothetical protein